MNTVSESFKAYSRDARVPVFKNGRPNPQAYRQISAGSIVGMYGLCVGYDGRSGGEGCSAGNGPGNANGLENIY